MQYERLGNYCYYCGMLSHEDQECEFKFEDKCKGMLVEFIQHAKGLASGIRVDSPKKNTDDVLFFALHQFFEKGRNSNSQDSQVGTGEE